MADEMANGSLVPLDAVIFDYGEVLCEAADPVHLTNMGRIAGLEKTTVKELYWKFRDDYDRGTLNGETYWQAIGQAAGRKFSKGQIASLVQEDVDSWKRLRPDMLAYVRKLQDAGIKTAVLSNMIPDLLEHMRRDFRWLDSFTCQTYSCEIDAVKPEPAIYRHTLEALAVEPRRALFIDDREVNIKGAQAVGIHGIVYRSREQFREELARGYDVPLP